jgi:integrase
VIVQSSEGSEEVGEERVKALSEDELRQLLDRLPDEWWPFFDFLSQTGLRIGEAIELRYGDVDGTWLNVDRRFYRGRVGLPKGRKKRRVPISGDLARRLWARRKEAHARDDDLIFTSTSGKRIGTSNTISRVLKPAAVEAGLGQWVREGSKRRADTWVGFHTFRHTTATRLFVGQGWNAVQVSKFLGHADAGFTLRTYVHLLPEDLPEPDFAQGVGNGWATQASESGRNAATLLDTESADLQAEASPALGMSGAP